MNLFDLAAQKKQAVDSKKRGNNAALHSTIKAPFFLSTYRKGEPYKIKVKAIDSKKKVEVSVKPLTGSFILSFVTCLSYDIVQDENRHIAAHNFACAAHDIDEKKADVTLSTYLCEVVASAQGFSLDDYAQGKTQGAKRFESHLKATREQKRIDTLSIDAQGIITGLTNEIVNAVLMSS